MSHKVQFVGTAFPCVVTLLTVKAIKTNFNLVH